MKSEVPQTALDIRARRIATAEVCLRLLPASAEDRSSAGPRTDSGMSVPPCSEVDDLPFGRRHLIPGCLKVPQQLLSTPAREVAFALPNTEPDAGRSPEA